jgi:hypothetical protein
MSKIKLSNIFLVHLKRNDHVENLAVKRFYKL